MVHNLSQSNSIIHQYLSEIRSSDIQKDSMRFRINMERIGNLLAYELSKHLKYDEATVETPLGIAKYAKCTDKLVLATILRAGLPLHAGFLQIFDQSENAFISAYRSHHKDGSFEIKLEYVTCPPLKDKVLVLIDPMLATGSSIQKTINELEEYGKPAALHIVAAIASEQGIDHVKRYFPDAHIWTAAIDEELTAKSYIVPGLGDAGDLAYGSKLQE